MNQNKIQKIEQQIHDGLKAASVEGLGRGPYTVQGINPKNDRVIFATTATFKPAMDDFSWSRNYIQDLENDGTLQNLDSISFRCVNEEEREYTWGPVPFVEKGHAVGA